MVSWSAAAAWGDHGSEGYLTTESDPAYTASVAAGIDADDVTTWNAAATWGDHGSEGYLTTESDPAYTASTAAGIDADDVTTWNAAAGWGDHGSQGYLTAESDPAYTASTAAGIDAADVSTWNTAATWGDHAAAGYMSDSAMALSASIGFSEDDFSSGNVNSYGTIGSCDDCVGNITMPFSVVYAGTSYSGITISSNGWIEFNGGVSGSDYTNDCLPTSAHDSPFLAAYWDDLKNVTVKHGYVGSSPNRVFLAHWNAETFTGGYQTDFLVQIHEGSGMISIRYFDMNPNANGQNATIGFQVGTNGGSSWPIVCNGKVLDDNANDSDPGSDGWSITPVR